MGMMESSVAAVEDILAYLARYMVGRDLAGYCELATAVGLTDEDLRRHPSLRDPYTLVSSDNALLTVFDVQGTYQLQSEDDFGRMIENLRVRQNGYMRRQGHSLTFAFERDPGRAMDELMRLAEPQINAARRMGLKSEDIILDRVRRNAPLVAWEQNLLVVYTHMNALSPEDGKRELRQRAGEASRHRLPRLDYGQSPASVLMALKYRHDAMLERIKFDFERSGPDGSMGIMLRQMSAHDAVRAVRIMINRERTSQKFRPVLPGDRFSPHGREDASDTSDLSPPLLGYQICTSDVQAKGNLVHTDQLVHGNLAMELGPQDPLPFAALLQNVDREIPWRIRIDLAPGGLDELRGRQLMVAFVGMLPANQQIRQSFLDLAERSKTDAICSMKVTVSTWSDSETGTRRHMAALEKALQAWGTCLVTSVHGDPLGAWASTIPAFCAKNLANRMVPPLPAALSMLPLQRPATPWADGGNMIVRTPDGKIYPIQLGSRLQDTWIDLYAGTPGSGKSALLSAMCSATVHSAGNMRLPLMMIAEVGPSSMGQIQLLRDSLPEHRKDEAVYLRLQNSTQFAVNLFDTQLGARYPTDREADFLVDFLNALCADPERACAPADCARVNAMLLAIAYEDRAGKTQLMYEPHVVPDVDRALAESGLFDAHDQEWWSSATWYEVTDMLFAGGFVREAAHAQRQAVPFLPDFTGYLNHETIRHLFGDARLHGDGEQVLSYMRRCFTVAAANYALFNARTRFELNSETRIIAIDLGDVIGSKTPEGSVKSTIMFLFARHMAAKNFFLSEETLMPVIPPLYRAYHARRVADIQDEKKVEFFDETHNAGGLKPFEETLIKDGREGRKVGVRVVASSQYLADHPPDLRAAATSLYIMRGGNPGDERILREEFAVSGEAIRRLQLEAVGPGPEGVTFLALFRTKLGLIVQMLTNTVGPIELWAFSTTLEDVALRTRLYKRIGTYAARRILAEHFPLGTALETIEQMRAAAGGADDSTVIERLADRLAQASAGTHIMPGEK